MPSNRFIKCSGCGGIVMDISGPVHRFIGANPGCWNVYTKVLSHKLTKGINNENRRLIVDTYAVQHPGKETDLTKRSVAIHLIALYYSLECGLTSSEITDKMKQLLKTNVPFYWLTPPLSDYKININDVYNSINSDHSKSTIIDFAKYTWNAWSEYHQVIKNWADR